MRYSVVLPRIETQDTDDARRALDRAHSLWEKGEQRAALDLVRQASESADAAGQKARAVALTRAIATLARAISPSQFPSHASDATVSAERTAVKERPLTTAVTEPPPKARAAPAIARATVPAKKARASAAASLSPESGPVRYGARAEPVRAAAVSGAKPKAALHAQSGPVSSSALAAVASPGDVLISAPPPDPTPAAPATPFASAPTVSLPIQPAGSGSSPTLEPAAPSSPPSPVSARLAAAPVPVASPSPVSASPEPDVVEDLVVTIAPSDWALASPNAIVGHRAQRVAVAPGRGPGGTMMVRPLAPGEVAPKGSIVAVMVALEPGVLPLPRTG